jgi:hypothetical protein
MNLKASLVVEQLEKNKNKWYSKPSHLNPQLVSFMFWRYEGRNDKSGFYLDVINNGFFSRDYFIPFSSLNTPMDYSFATIYQQILELQNFLKSIYSFFGNNNIFSNGSNYNAYNFVPSPSSNFTTSYFQLPGALFDVILESEECSAEQIEEIDKAISKQALALLENIGK